MTSLRAEALVAVVGAGAMGAGIAQVAATSGHQVLLYDAAPDAAARAIVTLAEAMKPLIDRGRKTQPEVDALLARIRPAKTLQDFAQADLIIEAIKEDLGIKQKLFSQLEDIVSDSAILSTNTSSLSITAIASSLRHPERFAGLHFFNPAQVMPLVEVVAGLATNETVLNTLVDTAKAWGKSPVRTKSTPGFIVNRVARPFYAEGLRILQENAADPATIDALLRDGMRFKMGPFELMDFIGHDVNFAVTSSVHAAYFGDPRFTPSIIQRELVEAGWLGRKSGRGFFDYAEGAVRPSPAESVAIDFVGSVEKVGHCGPAQGLVERLRRHGVEFGSYEGPGEFRLAGCVLAFSDGRSATRRAHDENLDQLVVFDLMDWAQGNRIAIAKADQTDHAALASAANLFARAGIRASVVDDIPGLVCLRTVAMLANEAADTVLHGVASAEDIDVAMQMGANYPAGPLAMADTLGSAFVLQVLSNIQSSYEEDRYRPSALLRRNAQGGKTFGRATP